MVNRLPPEVLAKVLSFRHNDRDLISATHVCERWRSTLLSTPMLWTEVVFGDPDRTITYLERSKGAPLHVSIGGSTLDFSAGDMSWIYRMSSLYICGEQEEVQSVAEQLCLPAPLLQSLIFDVSPGHQDWTTVGHIVCISPGFLGGQLPSLINLSFLSVAPSPDSSIPLQHLTSLEWTDSFVVVAELFVILSSAPLLEAIALNFQRVPMPGPEPLEVITLSKLRKLVWVIRGIFSLTRFLIAPELDDLMICMNYSHVRGGPSIILPPHRERVPLLAEPTALKYVCHNFSRTWDFTYASGHLTISESPDLFIMDPLPDFWLSPSTPISFGSTKQLVVEGYGGYPLPSSIPIEQFESLESLKLVGEVDRLLYILQPNGNITGGALPSPFLSHLEFHPTLPGCNFPFEALTEIPRERKEVGHGVKTVRIAGEYGECPSGVASGLTKLVDVLSLDRTPADTTDND